MKQVVLSFCVLAIAVGIYAGIVFYTVKTIRDFERSVLLGTTDAYITEIK